MQYIANGIITLSAIGLLSLGGLLAFKDQKAAIAVLGFGFLMAVLLVISKFKRFKGFGFEAEMWEEKQIEAAQLIDRLSTMSEAISRQVALIASRLGLWDSAFSNLELIDLIEDTRRLLVAGGISKEKQVELLLPAVQRVERNYWFAAQHQINKTYNAQMDNLRAQERQLPRDQRAPFAEKINATDAERGHIEQLIGEGILERKNLDAVLAIVRASTIGDMTQLSASLDEIDADMRYFRAKGTLRRRVDLELA